MKQFLIILLAFFLCSLDNAQAQPPSDTYILLKNATIIDGISDSSFVGSVLIKNDRIEEVSRSGDLTPPDSSVIYDVKGKYIIPGLIDAHVHLATNPSGSDNAEANKKRLEYLLKHGITSVRDMAGDTRLLGFLARQAALNEISSPDIYYSALMAGPTFFDDPRVQAAAQGAEPGKAPWMKAVDLQSDFKQAVAEAKGTGATGIKVYADLDFPVIQQVVNEAHKQGLNVWAHAAVFPAKPMDVIKAGVDVLSHATLLAWEGADTIPATANERYKKQGQFDVHDEIYLDLMNSMRENGAILDATVAVYQNERIDSSIFRRGVELTQVAYRNGVDIGVGTDNMGLSDLPQIPPLFKEMEMLVDEVGMRPIEVIHSATVVNAKMVGREKETGSVEAGKLANVVILNKNPLENISNINSIFLVIKKGMIID